MRKVAFAALAAGCALAACSGPVNRGPESANRGVESVNQPVVRRADYSLDLHRGAAGLAYGETGRLGEWFDTLHLGYGDRVSIDDPAAAPGVRGDVATVTARFGLLVEDRAPVTPGPVAPDSVRVVVSRATADVTGCPNWDRPSQPDFESSTSSDYGCATNHNLAVMVANKEDLVHGEEASGPDPRVTARAIKAYRDNAATGAGQTIKSEATKGN